MTSSASEAPGGTKPRKARRRAPARKTDAPRTITIFGGTGFIGRSLTRTLLEQGAHVRIASRRGRISQDADNGKAFAVAASIHSDEQVAQAVEGANAVVNLVGILYESGDQTFETVHSGGARRVAEACKAAGVERLVHMSAIGADPDSASAYARTKGKAEEAVREVFPDATIVRPSIVFGPDDDFFNRFAAMGRFAPVLPLIGGGQTRFQPVYVEDVASAIQTALSSDAAKGRTYELGGPQAYTFRELLEMLLTQKRWKRVLLPMPFFVAELQGRILERLPKPPLTRDQVELLKSDNVADSGLPGLSELGIEPTSVESILPTYL